MRGSTSALPTEICPTPYSGLIRYAVHVKSTIRTPRGTATDISRSICITNTDLTPCLLRGPLHATDTRRYDASGNWKVTSSNAKPLTPEEEFLLPNANAMSGRQGVLPPASRATANRDIEESFLTAKPEPGPRRNLREQRHG